MNGCTATAPPHFEIECGKEFNFKIGDRVVIQNCGKSYTTYDVAFKKLGFKNTNHNACPRQYEQKIVFKVFGMTVHEFDEDRKLIAIESLGGSKQVLINQNAIAKQIDNSWKNQI